MVQIRQGRLASRALPIQPRLRVRRRLVRVVAPALAMKVDRRIPRVIGRQPLRPRARPEALQAFPGFQLRAVDGEVFVRQQTGRPGLTADREGLDSERAIAWRAADSLSLRQFLDVALAEAPPDHSTVSRTRRRIDLETHEAVVTWVLQRLADADLVRGTTVGTDATTLEANAALRSIVRRDSGESYETFLRGLAAASGIPTPTRAELARLDRKRPKKGSNDDWTHPQDPDAKITKMKDGRTHLAHKAEHAVDLETGAVIGVTV